MNTINLPIQDFQKEPIQIWIYDRAKKTYVKAIKILGIIFLSILLLSTALVWVTLLYLILYSSNVRLESKLKKFRERNADASRSKELFDFYKATLNFKSVFEEEGEFRYPEKLKIFNPFFRQFKRFHMVQTEHASWLVDILYPTFEELQIPPEDVDFVRQQMTKEDFKDDAFYVEFEAEALLN